METLASPRMLLCSLRRLCLASLALAFLAVRDVRVKVSHVSPGQNQIHSQIHICLYFR